MKKRVRTAKLRMELCLINFSRSDQFLTHSPFGRGLGRGSSTGVTRRVPSRVCRATSLFSLGEDGNPVSAYAARPLFRPFFPRGKGDYYFSTVFFYRYL